MSRKTVALLVLFVVGRASAGAELTAEQLLREATPGGVALVDNDVDGAAQVREWLSPTHADRPVGALRGVCVPDRALLEQWRAQHPQHPGRAVWDAVLRDRTTTQIVFLAVRDDVLVPVCEAEVLRGQGFSQSPEFAAFRAALVSKMPVPAPPTGTPPTTTNAPPLPPGATSSAPTAPSSGPPAASGCW